nr:hypothetical protein [Tanacetum cinerariifolium]
MKANPHQPKLRPSAMKANPHQPKFEGCLAVSPDSINLFPSLVPFSIIVMESVILPFRVSYENSKLLLKRQTQRNLRLLVTNEHVENSDCVLPVEHVITAQNKFANSLVGSMHALTEITAEKDFKSEVMMVVLFVNREGHSMAKLDVEYEWKPSRCSDCLVFRHVSEQCLKRVKEAPKENVTAQNDGFAMVHNQKKKGKQAVQTRPAEDSENDMGKTSRDKEVTSSEKEKENNINYESEVQEMATQKMKVLKKPLRKLMHDLGNLHERAVYVQDFNEAKINEERFLKQKAKIEWLEGGPPRCAFKVDIQKAYDMVDWRFLRFILKCFGFHSIMIRGKRWRRQGEIFLPYLFTLVMEILTLILQRRVRMADIFRFHKHFDEMSIINVCFADDLFIFAHGDVDLAGFIMASLDEFKKRGKAKVAWDDICLPKKEGGLGLRSLKCKAWTLIHGMVGMDVVPPVLEDIIAWFQPLANKRSVHNIMGKLLFAAAAYFIWVGQNNRLFRKTTRTPEELRDAIVVTVHLKLVTFIFKNKAKVLSFLSLWKMATLFVFTPK